MVIVNHSSGLPEERCAPAVIADAGPGVDADPGIDGGGGTCACTVGTRTRQPAWPVPIFLGLTLLFVLRQRRY